MKNLNWKTILVSGMILILYILFYVNSFLRITISYALIVYGFLLTYLGIAALKDILERRIPNLLVLIGICGSLMLLIASLFFRKPELTVSSIFVSMISGIGAGSGVIFLLMLIGSLLGVPQGGVGMGDIKLFLPIGMLLGPQITFTILALSTMLAFIYYIVHCIVRGSFKASLPLGPFVYISSFLIGLYSQFTAMSF